VANLFVSEVLLSITLLQTTVAAMALL